MTYLIRTRIKKKDDANVKTTHSTGGKKRPIIDWSDPEIADENKKIGNKKKNEKKDEKIDIW